MQNLKCEENYYYLKGNMVSVQSVNISCEKDEAFLYTSP